MKNSKASSTAMVGIFIAIMIVIQLLTQFVYGVWPLPIQPTLMQIPVIIGAIILGPKKGAFLGFVMGLYSFLYSTFFPIPTSYFFTPFYHGGNIGSLVIAFVPRILIGIVPFYVYKLVYKLTKNGSGSAGLAGFAGAVTNTILVLGFIFVFFSASIKESFAMLVASIVSVNSIAEAVASIILTAAIVPILKKIRN